MAYELTIAREDNPISLEEWKQVISTIENAELASEETHGANPSTGERIAIQHSEGDVRIKLHGEWVNCIFFSKKGRASFKYADGIEDDTHPVHKVVSSAAAKLSASITGEEAEIYNW